MSMPLPFCVYVFFSEKDLLLYIGYTSNLKKRIQQHNAGASKSTAPRRPLKLIFCEYYLFEEDARKRAYYFKTSMGKKALKLMLAGTLAKMGYRPLAQETKQPSPAEALAQAGFSFSIGA